MYVCMYSVAILAQVRRRFVSSQSTATSGPLPLKIIVCFFFWCNCFPSQHLPSATRMSKDDVKEGEL